MINQKNLILAFNGSETGRIVNSALVNNGFTVDGIFKSGSELIRFANNLDSGGLIICGFKLSDMTSPQLFEMLPEGFVMLMLISGQHIGSNFSDEIFCLTLPLDKIDLIMSVNMILDIDDNTETPWKSKRRPVRSLEEMKLINQAKSILMDRYTMTEKQAHRFLQKLSMNSGKKILDTSNIILSEN